MKEGAIVAVLIFIPVFFVLLRQHGRADWHCMDDDLNEIDNVKRWRQ